MKEELGVSLPRDQLYLREDVDMRCNILMTGFVKKTLQKAHSVLVSRLLARSEYVEDVIHEQRFSTATTSYRGPSTYSSSGSHTSVSPHVAQEEYRNSTSLSYRPSTEVSVVHELGETSSPAELYSDPGFNEPESSHLGSSNVELNNPSTNNSGFIHAGLHNAGPNSPGFDCPKHNDPGLNDTEFNNPALNKYQSQRKANPYS